MSGKREPTFLGAPPVAAPDASAAGRARPAASGPAEPLRGPRPQILSLAVSGADRLLAAGLSSGVVELWMMGALGVPGLDVPFLRGVGHGKGVRAVAFCPVDPVGADGPYHLLASGSIDATIRTWHIGDPSRNEVLSYHESSVLALAWSPDGRVLASGSEDGTIALRGDGGRLQRRRAHDGSVLSLAFAPDGARYASGGADGCLRLWAADGGDHRLIAELGREALSHGNGWSLAFTPDGSGILFASGGAVGLWRPDSGEIRRWRDPADRYISRSYAVAVGADGAGFASHFDGDVALLDPATDGVRLRPAHRTNITSLAFLRDGRLASGDEDGLLCLWDPRSKGPKPARRLQAGDG